MGPVVIKLGGGKGIESGPLLRELSGMKDWVLVHGGSDEMNKLSEKLGHPPRFVESVSGFTSRVTDRATVDIISMAAAGKLNVGLVAGLQALGVNAVGLCGVDGRLLEGARKEAIKIVENGKRKVLRDDFTGTVEKVNAGLLRLLLDNGYFPVVTIPIISPAGEPLNTDGDRAAAAVAGALKAEALVILSNVPGLLENPDDPSTLVRSIPRAEIDRAAKFAKDRMKKKMLGAKEALELGAGKVAFGSADVPSPVASALSGAGTLIS
jgi:acetylglutamate/LysW-gamma-L-alpha-aminoadipate kinase